MAERAGLFEDDLSEFTPKKAVKTDPSVIRQVAEQAHFQSREPAKIKPKADRRYRTGRNEQFNIKVRATDKQAFYGITDAQGWVQGYTFERAIQALQRELDKPRAQE